MNKRFSLSEAAKKELAGMKNITYHLHIMDIRLTVGVPLRDLPIKTNLDALEDELEALASEVRDSSYAGFSFYSEKFSDIPDKVEVLIYVQDLVINPDHSSLTSAMHELEGMSQFLRENEVPLPASLYDSAYTVELTYRVRFPSLVYKYMDKKGFIERWDRCVVARREINLEENMLLEGKPYLYLYDGGNATFRTRKLVTGVDVTDYTTLTIPDYLTTFVQDYFSEWGLNQR